jgi:hypothetical protein
MRTFLTATGIALMLALAYPAISQADVVTGSFPLDLVRFVPCANGGSGESVHVTGTIHFRSSTFVDGIGNTHDTIHVRSEGVTAIGLTTGTTYQFQSLSRDVSSQKDQVAGVVLSVNHFRLIGRGSGTNSWEHNVQVVVFTNGTLRVSFLDVNTVCR